jgi:hypothetical protein
MDLYFFGWNWLLFAGITPIKSNSSLALKLLHYLLLNIFPAGYLPLFP